MLKKSILILLLLMIFATSSFCALVTTKKNTVGLDAPVVGWLSPNLVDKTSGQVISNLGVNWGLGVSYRRYFEPLRTNQLNTFWAVGTVALIIPYIGIGGDYVWDNGFYLGGGIIWVVPEIHGGFMF